MRKNIRNLSLCVGAAICLPYSQASASSLTGACFDYATRPATSAVAYDSKSVGIFLANNLLSAGLAAGGNSFSTVSLIYPFVYSAVKGGIVEETTDAADPELVGCLEELDGRISSVEGDLLQGQLNNVVGEIGTLTDEVNSENFEYHKSAASRFSTIAFSLAHIIVNTIDDTVVGGESPSVAEYDALIENVIPGYISTIQLELLSKTEFDRYCFGTTNYPAWQGVDLDEQVGYSRYEQAETGSIGDYITRPEGSSCSMGFASYQRFKSLFTDDPKKNADHYDALKHIGIEVTQNPNNPSLISASVNFTDSKLTQYRQAFVEECSGNSYNENYLGRKFSLSSSTSCNSHRTAHLESLSSNNIFNISGKSKDKSILAEMAYLIDTWDLDTLTAPHLTLLDPESVYPETYTSVRLKHAPSNTCIGDNGIADRFCGAGEHNFVFRPLYGPLDSRAYTLALVDSNTYLRNFNKGELTLTSTASPFASWYVSDQDENGLSEIRSFSFQDCLILNSKGVLDVGSCGADSHMWDINGSAIPTSSNTGQFIRLRDVEAGICVSADCDAEKYEFQIFPLSDGYRVTRVSDGRHLKDKEEEGIAIRSSLGSGLESTWYFTDKDGNGLFSLRNKYTGKCLTNNGVSLVASDCGSVTEAWKIDTSFLPSGDYINLTPASGNGFCLGGYSDRVNGYIAGSCENFSKTVLSEYNGGFLIVNAVNQTYMQDIETGFGMNSLQPVSLQSIPNDPQVSGPITWDFIGPDSDGSYKIRNRRSGQCLSARGITGGSTGVFKVDCSDSTATNWIRKEG